jgi:hypothetical protein
MTNKTEERIVVKMHLFDNTCQSDYTIDVIIPKWRMGCTPIGGDDVISALAKLYQDSHIDVMSIQKIETVGHEIDHNDQGRELMFA